LPDNSGHPRSQAYRAKSKKVAVEEGLWLTFQQCEEIVDLFDDGFRASRLIKQVAKRIY
jgi:hypothetical protein